MFCQRLSKLKSYAPGEWSTNHDLSEGAHPRSTCCGSL